MLTVTLRSVRSTRRNTDNSRGCMERHIGTLNDILGRVGAILPSLSLPLTLLRHLQISEFDGSLAHVSMLRVASRSDVSKLAAYYGDTS